MFFLGINICIHFLNGTFPSIRENLLNTPPNEVKIPVIVHSELWFGVQKSQLKKENTIKLQRFLEPFDVVSYTSEIPKTYSELRLQCESDGNLVGPNDLLIASIVVANNDTLVTRNTKEFSRIGKLKTVEW